MENIKNEKIILIFFIVCVFITVFAPSVYAATGSIFGTVAPNDTTIRVQLIQNLSWINEINISETGAFSFSNVPEGNYGLLFIWNKNIYDAVMKEIFVYNDIMNDGKYGDFLNITDNIIVISGENSEIFTDLNNESVDFVGDHFLVVFDKNISDDQIESLIGKYNCTIKENTTILNKNYVIIPTSNKTVLELIREFRNEPIVESSYYDQISSISGGDTIKENGEGTENESTEQNIDKPVEREETSPSSISIGDSSLIILITIITLFAYCFIKIKRNKR